LCRLSVIFDYRDMLKNNASFNPPPFLEDSIGFVKSQKSPVCVKTHFPYHLLPKEIQNGSKKPKVW
jgi:hypothetical protein